MPEAAHAQPAWVLLAYLVAGVCFILALRGLSSPVSSRRGNRLGMIGMAIAVVTTLITHAPVDTIQTGMEAYHVKIDGRTALEILAAIAIGAVIGLVTARMLAMYKKKERKPEEKTRA
jgi:NAD(P) transhydrogenase subunit beta